MGLWKNRKHHFLLFKDNRASSNYSYIKTQNKKESIQAQIDNNFNYFTQYSTYLPRNNCLNILKSHPEWLDYFQRCKLSLNNLTTLNLNSLANEEENLDWFVYDEESVNFLLSMEKLDTEIKSHLKFINKKIFFEDRNEFVVLENNDWTNFYVNVNYIIKHEKKEENELVTRKIQISNTTTSREIIDIINDKLRTWNPELAYDAHLKIWKVKSWNDYIFNETLPWVNYTYINECYRLRKEPDFVIVDNPLYIDYDTGERKAVDVEDINNTNANWNEYYQKQIEHWQNIATNKPIEGNEMNREAIIQTLGKSPLQVEENKYTNDKWFTFVTDCVNDINALIKESLDDFLGNEQMFDMQNFDNWAGEINDFKGFDEDDINGMNEKFSVSSISINQTMWQQSFCNNISMLNTTLLNPQKKRHIVGVKTPNVFYECEKWSVEYKKMYDDQAQSINIKDIERPFSIWLRYAKWNKDYQSTNLENDKNVPSWVIIIFKMQVLCGNKSFSKPRQIKWVSLLGDQQPCFNKRIYFDINYNSVPNFVSVLFKVKHVLYNSNNEIIGSSPVGWCNFRWFDHNKRFKSGTHKLSLFDRVFNDDAYYCFTDNNAENTLDIYFELDSFVQPMINKVTKIKNYTFNTDSWLINQKDMTKIDEIKGKSPFEEWNNYDKEILWSNRYILAKMPHMVSKWWQCFNYNNQKHWIELEKIFELAGNLTTIQALDLLSGKFWYESIRAFAVKCLRQSPSKEIEDNWYQWVQALKYEVDHSSELAKFLIERAINYPVTIGHKLFWYLRSEMFNQDVQQRYGLYLVVFLNKIGPHLLNIYNDEDFWVKNLLKILTIPMKKTWNKEQRKQLFNESINAFNQTISFDKKNISLPYNFKVQFKAIDLDKSELRKEEKNIYSLHLSCINPDELSDEIKLAFKKGKDLRVNKVVLDWFNTMQNIWWDRNIDVQMTLYNFLSTGANHAMIEQVNNYVTWDEVHKTESNVFTKTNLKKWLENYSDVSKKEYTANFWNSISAYCVSTFIWGIQSRNEFNMKIKLNGEIFHTDFTHILGHVNVANNGKYLQTPFSFYNEFLGPWRGEKGEEFLKFKEIIWQQYSIIRDNKDVIITLLRVWLCSGINEIDDKSIKHWELSLALNKKEEEAKKILTDHLKRCIDDNK